MNYKFELADHISDYLPAIAGRSEFIIAEKEGGYTVINYVVQMADSFPDPNSASSAEERRNFILRRDCRGIIFDTTTGKVIAKRLHKFFNVNERDETQLHNIDFNEPHVILEKLDGSMITPVVTTDGIRWGTKMGVTEVALPVEEFIKSHPEYVDFVRMLISDGITAIFEWCSRKQLIVIDYGPADRLVLTAMRINKTGHYVQYDFMVRKAELYGIPCVKAYEGTAENMQALIDYTRDLIGEEGFVVRFDDGHMIKVKAEEYVRKHKAKESLSREKNVIELLVTEKLDDIKGFLDAKDLERIRDFEGKFWIGVKDTADMLIDLRWLANREGHDVDRRTYAVNFVQSPSRDSKMAPFLYKMFDVKSPAEVFRLLTDVIAKSCSTQAKINDVRWIFNCDWNEVVVDE